MKSLVLLLVVATFAQGSVLPGNTAFGYLAKSFEWAEKLRQLEEEQQNQRIIGGSAAALGQLPYQVGLLSDVLGVPNANGICGGSLLNSNRVLTAAHCWFDGWFQVWRYTVVLGSTTLWSGGYRVQSTFASIHPNWFPALARNDVAIVYLPNPVTFSNTIAPISLPSGSELQENFVNNPAIISGFGSMKNGSAVSPNLNYVSVNVITNDECRPSFPLHLHDTNICTSGAGIVGTCSGDSGGPLAIQRGNRTVLIGVTSFGPGPQFGCEGGLPSAYARVTSFMNYIQNHV